MSVVTHPTHVIHDQEAQTIPLMSAIKPCFRTDYSSSNSVGLQRPRKDKAAPSSGPRENAAKRLSREELYRRVDNKFDGSDREKEEAYNLLKDKSSLVWRHPK